MLTAAFVAACCVQLAYWFVLRKGFRRAQKRSAEISGENGNPPISIVVAARNEEAGLPSLLEALARQRYRPEAVIIVDDDSTDRTAAVVEAFGNGHPNALLVRVTEPRHPRKKNALTIGIAESPTDLIAFTDADCTPGQAWTEILAKASAGRDRLLISHSPFRVERSSVNLFSRYETFLTGYLAAAGVGLGRPYMAVGRNMCYRKSLFDAVDGFEHSRQSLSGDDDLFVQHVARQDAAEVIHVFAPGAYVRSDPPATWREWIRQKIRHTSAGRFYPRSARVHLTTFQATNLLVWIAPLVLGWTGALLLGIKLVVQGVVLREGERVLDDRGYVSTLPLLDFGYVLYNLLIAPIGLVRMPRKW